MTEAVPLQSLAAAKATPGDHIHAIRFTLLISNQSR